MKQREPNNKKTAREPGRQRMLAGDDVGLCACWPTGMATATGGGGGGDGGGKGGGEDGGAFQHVLLLSIDGFHAVDYLNCVKAGTCPNLAALGQTGVNYLATSTSKPSDSFPGLTAIISGESLRRKGAFYDSAYDQSLQPPALTTGNGLVGAPGLCG